MNKNENVECQNPFDGGVCQVCKNFSEKDGCCMFRPNWGDRPGEIDEKQPYLSAENVKVCRKYEYSLDFDRIFKILKEYKKQKEIKK